MDYRRWYESQAARLSGGGLWLRGGEINTLPPEEFDRRDYRVLFTRLSTYFDTGYSFTHQILYQYAAGLDGVFPDLAYLPPRGDAARFAEGAVPWLLGTQTKRPGRDFDLIGISNSIVQELINLPWFLRTSGIPFAKAERMADPDCPLVLMGGANALYSSAIWDEGWVDGIFVGESDQAIRRLLEIGRDGKRAGLSKTEILARMETVPGFFQPESPRPTKKAFIWSLNRSEALEAGPVYYLEDQLGRSHLQISEGCPCFCSFCAESWDRKPYRERDAAVLREVALKMKAAMGLDAIDLYSFNFNMHSGFYRVLWDLVPLFKRISLKSQRFDLLAHDPEMIEFQHAIEKASLTCGLEGISPRLRSYLHKNLDNEVLHRSLSAIFKSKARELKVFLIATGLEEDQDFLALEDLLGHFRRIRDAQGVNTRLVFSMTPLVRFPWTPLEFEDGYSMNHYGRILQRAAKTVRRAGFEFREAADLPEYWVSQVLVRAADRRVGEALREAVVRTGFVYYREVTPEFQRELEKALAEKGLDPAALLRGHGLEDHKPWAAVDTGVKRDFLWKEVLRARQYVEIDYCLGRNWKEAKCFLCGGCPSKEHILAIVKAKQVRDYSLEQFKARLAEARRAERNVDMLVEVGPLGKGVPRKMVAVAVARALMLAFPELTAPYRGFSGSHWARDEKPCWVTGEDRFTFTFLEPALETLRRIGADPLALARVNGQMGGWARVIGVGEPRWAPALVRVTGDFRFSPDAWLKSLGIKYTFRRLAADAQEYELTPPSLRKGILKSLRVAGGAVELAPGPKFEVSAFLKGAFQGGPPTWDVVSRGAPGVAE